jgi:hypothetical protein
MLSRWPRLRVTLKLCVANLLAGSLRVQAGPIAFPERGSVARFASFEPVRQLIQAIASARIYSVGAPEREILVA